MPNTNLMNLKEIQGLSEKEKQYLLRIIGEVSSQGSSKTLDNLKFADYNEIPVDIETFLTDDRYLGKAWKDASGKSKLYPFWLEQLKKLFPNNVDTNYNTFLESGARGIGKSEVACGCVCTYLMYRVMCMKNPLEFFHLKLTEKICFAFMNIKLDLAEEIAASKFQNTIQMSPWFMSKGSMTSKNNKPWWNPPEPIQIIIGSQSDDVIGLPIYFAFFDEISFVRNQDIDKQKKKAKDMIDTAIGGMFTRFIHGGKNPTVLAVASSKRSEQSFMEEYIKTLSKTSAGNTLVIDKPVWEVKPKGTYSSEMFYVGLGNKYLSSIVIPEDDRNNLDSYRDRGYQILEVPIDFRAKFIEDIERNLCDFAGISSSSMNKYISGEIVKDCINEEYKNPFPDIIEVGNGPEDLAQYKNFFKLEYIPKELMSKPLYIHLDMSVSGDMTGIAGVWITGKKVSTTEDQSKDLNFRLAFSVSIKAPKGRQISFEKNRNFIRWLKEVGFKIKHITSDTYQSYDLQQQLTAEGFECSILSVDRVDSDRICKPYQYLKSTVYEKRFSMYRSDRLFDEFLDIERDLNTGKIDHTPCFTGDTKVRLLDGRSLSFVELLDEFNSGKVNYVYSINLDNMKIEPKPITNVLETKQVTKLCKVTLDNGEVIKCTPEHKFMLRNGCYVEAQDLLPNDSLMPLYTKIAKNGLNGYRMYYEPISDQWHYEHRQFANDVLDEKYLVHHKNCNKLDNTPTNLLWMSKSKHVQIHSEMQTGAQSPNAKRKRSDSVREWHKNTIGTKQYDERNNKLSQSNKLYWRKNNPEFLNREELRKIQVKSRILEYFPDIDFDSLSPKQVRGLSTKIQHLENKHVDYTNAHEAAIPKLKQHNDLMSELKILFPSIDKQMFIEFFGFDYDSLEPNRKGPWVNRYRKKLYELKNHTVVSVEIYDCDLTSVYDITVESNHNFALDSGVFVHNCGHKDALDAVCGATFTASKYAEQYAFDYGEDLETTKVVSTSGMNEQQQISQAFEEELMRMFNPIVRQQSSNTGGQVTNNVNNQTQTNTSTSNEQKQKQPQYLDFGMGPAKPLSGAQFMSQGIIVW